MDDEVQKDEIELKLDPKYTPDFIRDVSVEVYKMRLESPSGGGPGAVDRMLLKDGDDGVKLRRRAQAYDPLTRAYLKIVG